jgi:WD40 repeat protein
MAVDLRASIVRILDSDGETAGTGFVVTVEGLIATCAHVVELAGSGPGGTVGLKLHATGEEREATVYPEYWTDPDAQDVAILELEGKLPKLVEPLMLGSSPGSEDHPFHTFGFPEQKPKEGTPGGGIFLQWATENGFEVLTLRSPEVARGFSGAPALDDAKRRVVGMVVSIAELDRSGRGGETGWAIPAETLQDVCPALRRKDIPPYRGLDAFTEDDAKFFCGRQLVVESLLEILRDEPPLLAVLGPSGSGKSSVVQAGVVPHLRQGKVPGSDRWELIVDRQYGDDPFESLMRQGLEGVENGLVNAAKAWLDQHSDKERLVLVMDQFEQLLVDRPLARRQEFLEQLTQLLREPLDVTVVVVMRDDFFSRLAQQAHALVNEVLQAGSAYHIPGELDSDELTAIVREPAEGVGLRFESGLIETILSDALETAAAREAGRPVARITILPLLEFALTQLWEEDHREGELTHETYNRIGGVTGSLGRWANKAYRSLGKELQPIARRILTDLVHLGDEGEGIPDSRKRRSLNDLCRTAGEKAKVLQVVQHLADARLVVTTGEISSREVSVQIIHDALLREWPQLRHWLHEDRLFLIRRQEMEGRTRAWIETAPNNPGQRDEGRLLRGRDLAEAEGWLREHSEELSKDEITFIETSRESQSREEQRWKDLYEEAEQQREEAERQRQVALARQLGAQAQMVAGARGESVILKGLLAAESVRRHWTLEGMKALQEAVSVLHRSTPAMTTPHVSETSLTDAIALSPDGMYFAMGSEDIGVRIWESSSGREVSCIVEKGTYRGWLKALTFSPDGNLLAISGRNEKLFSEQNDGLFLWNVGQGREERRWTDVAAPDVVAFSQNGRLLITDTRTLEVTSGREITRFDHVKDRDSSRLRTLEVAVSRDCRYLATTTTSINERITITVWDTTTGRKVRELEPAYRERQREYGDLLRISPTGRYLAHVQSSERNISTVHVQEVIRKQRSVRSGRKVLRETYRKDHSLAGSKWELGSKWDLRPGGRVTSLAFSPDERYLAIAGYFDTRVLEVGTGRDVARIEHKAGVERVAFSPDGRYLVCGSRGIVLVWELSSRRTVTIMALHDDDPVKHVATNSDGTMIAGASWEGVARVWRLSIGSEVSRMIFPQEIQEHMKDMSNWSSSAHEKSKNLIAFNPTGTHLVVASRKWCLSAWEVSSGRLVARDVEWPLAMNFGSDGHHLSVVSSLGERRVWDIAEGTVTRGERELFRHDFVLAAAFSSDGAYRANAFDNTIVIVYETASASPLWSIDYQYRAGAYGYAVGAVALSSGARYLATGSDDCTARVWRSDGYEIARLPEDNYVMEVAFSSGSHPKYLVTNTNEPIARLWEIATGRELARLIHGGGVTTIAFSPDSKYLVTGSGDGVVHVWEVPSGRELTRIGHSDGVSSVTFSPDGRWLAVASTGSASEPVANVRPWRPEDLIEQACERLTRNLTPEEWQYYLGDEPYRKTCPNLP